MRGRAISGNQMSGNQEIEKGGEDKIPCWYQDGVTAGGRVSTEATSVESHLVLLVLVCSDNHRVHEHADPDD